MPTTPQKGLTSRLKTALAGLPPWLWKQVVVLSRSSRVLVISAVLAFVSPILLGSDYLKLQPMAMLLLSWQGKTDLTSEDPSVIELTNSLAGGVLALGLASTAILTLRTWVIEQELKRRYAEAHRHSFAKMVEEELCLSLGKLLKALGLEHDGRAYIYVPDMSETVLRVKYRSDSTRGANPDLDFPIAKGQGWMWISFQEYSHITDLFLGLSAQDISSLYGDLDIRYCESLLQQGVRAIDCRPIFDGHEDSGIAGVLVIDSRRPFPSNWADPDASQREVLEALAYARSLMNRIVHGAMAAEAGGLD